MKNIIQLHLFARLSLLILFGFAAVTGAMAQTTTFFSDSFGNGSTVTNLTPTHPTINSADYQIVAAKAWSPLPSVSANDLQFGIPATGSGIYELQALFSTNAVALSQVGDFIQLTVVFTNTSGVLTASGYLGVGLYNGNQVQPVPGGLNATLNNTATTDAIGYVQGWQGYVGQVGYTGLNSRIMTRAAQTGTANNNQDLVTSGSSSSYSSPVAATVGSTTPSTVSLTAGSVYTEVLNITLTDVNTLSITNSLYNGPDTNSPLLQSFGGVASGATYVAGAFDGLAIGYFARNSGSTNTIDIASIQVIGHQTTISGPPTITSEPTSIQVATNGSGAFSVAATGFGVTYQWHRNGTNLVDDGYNISGATSSRLTVSHVGVGDALSGANGYYATVSGTGGYSTNSTTNSLTLVPMQNLTWNGASSGAAWDLNTSANWLTNGTPGAFFNYGDAVTFDDMAPVKFVTLTGNYLSASSVTVNSSGTYTFAGTGSFAGPSSLNYIGAGQLTLNNVNTYSGGTLISNALAYVYLQNYNGLGTGPVTLAKAGGTIETVSAGSGTLGFNGDINVLDDFTIKVDGVGTYATVFLGNLSGTSGKTLTINPALGGTINRFRVYGNSTVLDANLVIDDPNVTGDAAGTEAIYTGTVLAPYGATGSQIYNGVISGVGGIVQRGNCTTHLNNNQNTYSGGTVPTGGTIALGADSVPTTGTVTSGPLGTGPLLIAPEVNSTTGTGTVLASGGSRTIANLLQYPSGTNNLTLAIGGTNNLTFTGPFGLNGLDGVTDAKYSSRFFQITNTGATTFAGAISDSSSFYALTKTGAGALYLNAANSYTGSTTNSAGLLAGSGSLTGPVVVLANASIGGGSAASIGTLTINNNLTLNGNVFIRVNKSLTQSNDLVFVSGVLTNGGTGTVTVTNIGGQALVVGDSFKIFSGAVSNGAALTITGGGPTVTWNNNLAVNGTISVGSLTVPVPVVNSTVLSGSNLIMSGTNGTSGATYYVVTSTNVATPFSAWVPVLTNTFTAGGAFSATNAINYGDHGRFYMLKLP